ncbi:receptor-type tyrosine-protein phosphatase F-like isoform X2 [Oscarella lobularis]|uniref:receptor-type tyrosine-protein phosphatase F-like isoform X2 n=1 Tax=Oscarella lobularis TaxID=121494 RepID=UPI0033144A81
MQLQTYAKRSASERLSRPPSLHSPSTLYKPVQRSRTRQRLVLFAAERLDARGFLMNSYNPIKRHFSFVFRGRTILKFLFWTAFLENVGSSTTPPPPVPNAPTFVTVFRVTQTAVTLLWNAPAPYGPITNYTVYYVNLNVTGDSEASVVVPRQLIAVVSNLIPFTTYKFQVTGSLKNGLIEGIRSTPVFAQTLEAAPSSPPRNVGGVVVAVNASIARVRLSWEPPPMGTRNGVIIGYTVFYQKVGQASRTKVSIDNAENNVILFVEPFQEFSFSVAARTNAGEGPDGPNPPFSIRTDSVAVPLPSSGLVVTAHCDSCSPAQLLVQWEALLIFGSAIAYEIHYSGEEFDTDLHSINASGSVNFTVLDNLEEFLVYDVQIRAYYQDGPGPFFPSQSARTYAAPSLKPTVVSIENVNMTSSQTGCVRVTWSNPAPRDVNGLYYATQILWRAIDPSYVSCYGNDGVTFVTVQNETETTAIICGLKSYWQYSFYVRLMTKGLPVTSKFFYGKTFYGNGDGGTILTSEEEPSGAPRNVTVSAVPGRKELFVKWRELQCFETNGKLNKYVVYFAAENSTLKSLDVSPDSTNVTLSYLESFTQYSVWMQAFTGRGGGPFTSVVHAMTSRVCECFSAGSVNQTCSEVTGQCPCNKGVQGQNCDICILSGRRFSDISECFGATPSVTTTTATTSARSAEPVTTAVQTTAMPATVEPTTNEPATATVPNEPDIVADAKNSTWIRVKWSVIPNGVLTSVEGAISSGKEVVKNTSNVTGVFEFGGLVPYRAYTIRVRAYSDVGASAIGLMNVSTCEAAPLTAPVIHSCQPLRTDRSDDERREIRLNFSGVRTRAEWRGEPRGYKVSLLKGNPVMNNETVYIDYDESIGSSYLDVLQSSFTFDSERWYTVLMAAETRFICGNENLGPVSSPCKFRIESPATVPPATVPPDTNAANGGVNTSTLVLAVGIPAAALILIFGIVITVVCLRKRRARQRVNTADGKGSDLKLELKRQEGDTHNETIRYSTALGSHTAENPAYSSIDPVYATIPDVVENDSATASKPIADSTEETCENPAYATKL